jgi:hypothetical protein
MDVEYWKSGALVTFLLDFGNGNGIATQAIVLEPPAKFSTKALYDLRPALMKAAHLLEWQCWDSTGGEHSAHFWCTCLDEITRVADATGTIRRNTPEAVTARGVDDIVPPWDDVLR